VGGRDWIRRKERVENRTRRAVGKVQWFGRMTQNHHLGVGGPREVDLLKRANMSYRRTAIEGLHFDERLRGSGAQPCDDWSFSLAVKRAGWKLIYDPAVAVDHHVSPRCRDPRNTDEDKPYEFSATTVSDHVHNQTLMLLEHFPPLQRLLFGCWALFVGSRDSYGLVQWLRFVPHEGRLAGAKLRASLKGRIEGWKTWRRHTA